MSQARTTFTERLEAYESAISTDIIVTKTPADTEHNARARLYRNGLAVVAFALLEDFIKSRTGEVLSRVGAGLSNFTELPHNLRIAATSGVVRALNYQERFMNSKQSDYFTHYQKHGSLISSTQHPGFQISPIAFGFDQANINSAAVSTILRSFNIDQPWNTIEGVAHRVGVGGPALKEAFENAMIRRHEAAHRADANVEPTDLQDFVTEVLGIALGVDVALSLGLRKILDRDQAFLGGSKIANHHVKLRLIEFDGKWWREIVPGNKRATARNENLETLKTQCFYRAKTNEEAVVVQDVRGLPRQWYTPFVD